MWCVVRQEDVSETEGKGLKWYGHVRRKKEEPIVRGMIDVDIPHLVVLNCLPGKRRRGGRGQT